MIEALVIIDEERRRLLRIEGREARPFATLPAQLDAPADDVGDGDPGADVIEEMGRVLHGPIIGGIDISAIGTGCGFRVSTSPA